MLLPSVVRCDFPELVRKAGYPSSKMIAAQQALLSLLALKLSSAERKSHVRDLVFDDGYWPVSMWSRKPPPGHLFAQRLPQDERAHAQRLDQRAESEKLLGGKSFNLDFHTIPYFGEGELVERHYLSKRSRSQKSILVFLAHYAENSGVLLFTGRPTPPRAGRCVLGFEFWKKSCGRPPTELVFDSRLTTYGNLNRLNRMGITFMTGLAARNGESAARRWAHDSIRRATSHLSDTQGRGPADCPFRFTRANSSCCSSPSWATNTPPYCSPTICAVPPPSASPRTQRTLIENSLADSADFFHLDAFSSAVGTRIDFYVALTEVATGLYRVLAQLLPGCETAKSRQILRHFLNTAAQLETTEQRVQVSLPKRAHDPLLIAASFNQKPTPIPWWQGRPLHIQFR